MRNAIILVDYINARVKEGVTLEQAALEADQRRLRPIFLTTMAAAVGVAPMIISGSSLWSPLASTIAIGLITSMFFTLLVVPVLYVLVKRRTPHLVSSSAIAAGALALVLMPMARAEERRITLEDAVNLALENNSLIKLSSLKVQEAEAKRLQARSNYFPQITNESTLYNMMEKQRLTLPAGSLGTVPMLGAIPSAPTTIFQGGRALLLAQTTAAQPLTQLFKIREGNAVAQADVALAKTQSGRARIEIAAKTKELYYALLGLEARRRASQASIVAAEERLKERKDEMETGTILEVRSMQAKAALLESKQIWQPPNFKS